jgi:hypothetical protein
MATFAISLQSLTGRHDSLSDQTAKNCLQSPQAALVTDSHVDVLESNGVEHFFIHGWLID